MKKTWEKILLLFTCMIISLSVPLTVYADTGPKPSVKIEITGIRNEIYYGTLLSKEKTTGPSSVWDGTEEGANYQTGEHEIWKKFVSYQDKDGFYFLQELWECTETNQLNWTYYPPKTFKILLYFPESDTYYVSPICDRYAFDSYFTVDVSDYAKIGMTVEKSYNYT